MSLHINHAILLAWQDTPYARYTTKRIADMAATQQHQPVTEVQVRRQMPSLEKLGLVKPTQEDTHTYNLTFDGIAQLKTL